MKKQYTVVIIAYCLLLLYLASITPPRELTPGVPGLDKAAHAGMYGLLAALLSLGMGRSARQWLAWQRFAVPAAVASGYGAALELYQALLPHRVCDPWDVAANTAGSYFGTL